MSNDRQILNRNHHHEGHGCTSKILCIFLYTWPLAVGPSSSSSSSSSGRPTLHHSTARPTYIARRRECKAAAATGAYESGRGGGGSASGTRASAMQEGFDPPETEIGISARKDVVVEQDSVSSYRPWGSMKFEEDGHLLSHAKRGLPHLMVDYARGSHYVDDITPISRQWCFDDGSPSLPRGMQYGDEIPSLSSKMCNEAPSRSSLWQYGDEIPSFSRRHDYGDEIPSFSRRHDYGDEIPSLSRNWRYRDKIPLHSGHCYHYAESHPLPRYQEGVSHGNGQSRHNFARMNTNEQVKVTTSKHTSTKHRMLNRFVNSSNHYRSNMKDNPWRNSEDIMDQVRGPRAKKLNNISVSSTEKDIISPLVRRDQFNRSDFSTEYEHAKFFMIKSYSEDDIHKGIKYNVWASTPNGNNKLDAAFHEAQTLMKEKGGKCPVFLFFSVNTSGQFVGLAEMLGPVDFKKTMDFWQQDKWNGFFPVVWHIIKDIPNRLFKHIILENNDNRIVTFSRDTQEIGRPQGLQMLRIFKAHRQETSILDDFDFYEEKDNARRAQKRGNSESTHQARFSDDSKSMENLEGSMESWSLYENWD
ncbi:YTH domain-containing protein ECT2-like isoform X3 [Phragmites australis]|uniref:YTH domain-containing protein ECT2-like isoform X3 n=1 Tax=Phragmites australis TaxID=29695 RepID=UPI002D76984E|nr:YTH domain-containing protein ECT2-like isoform X3 [Phragmites australis]